MKKNEFLSELSNSLGSMPDADKQDVLNDYEEHFRVGMVDGRSEEDIAQSLGNPSAIGATYRVSAMLEKPNEIGQNATRKPLSRTHLRNTIFMLIAAYLATGWAGIATFCTPLMGIINDLGSGGGGVITPPQRSAWETILAPGIAIFISLLAVLFAASGVYLDRIRWWVWIILLVLGLFIFLNAVSIPYFIAPAFQHMWKELRHP